MIENVNLECIKIIADPFNYLPTIYIFAGMAHHVDK